MYYYLELHNYSRCNLNSSLRSNMKKKKKKIFGNQSYSNKSKRQMQSLGVFGRIV